LTQIPKERNTWLFSATMPDEVKRISREYMNNPVEVRIGSKDEVNKDIDHQYVLTHRAIKYDVLRRFLDYSSDTFCLVFCRTRMDARDLAEALVKDGYDADALHGDLNQSQRDRVMARFKNQHLKVLVATDVAARGIDVQDITHVFHYNIPDDFSFYTHRSGRTGRAGSKGVSLILAHPKEEQMIRTLSNKLKIDITKAHIPTGKEICERRLMAYMNSVRDAEINEEAKSFMPKVVEAMSILSKEEIIEKVAALTFNGFLQLYQDAPDLNMNSKRKEDRAAGGTGGDMKRLFINIGSLDMDGKGLLINLVCSQSKISGSMIGRIDFRQGYSFFDVDASVAERVIQSFENENFNGRPLRVNIDEGATETKGKKDRHRNQPKFEGKEDAKPRFDAAKKDSYRRKKTKR
jgi:ATP-dependent RNA helicase DeaD